MTVLLFKRYIVFLACLFSPLLLYANVTSNPTQLNKTNIITWQMLSEMDSNTGTLPKSLLPFKNKEIQVAGFMVPLEMGHYIDKVKVFALVPDPLSCVHIPPPPPNQMIFVTMKKPIPIDMDFRGVSINGTITIAKPKIQALLVGYEMEGISASKAEIDFNMNELYQKAHELKDGVSDEIFDNITDETRFPTPDINTTDPTHENFFYTEDFDKENPIDAKNLDLLNDDFE